MLILEICNCILLILSVILLSKEKRIGWLFSLLGCITMGVIYYKNDLLYQVAVQIIFLIQSGIAYLKWNNKNEINVKQVNIFYYIAFYFFISVSCIYFKENNILSYTDLFLMFVSLSANHLLIYKKKGAWYLWLLFNIISIQLYLYLKLYITVALFMLLTAVCIFTILKHYLDEEV